MEKLMRGEMLRITEGLGCEVRVRQGRVWITQHHDNADYIVEAGGSFRIYRPGPTLVSAMKEAAAIEFGAPATLADAELAAF
jgi:hypothetical protein